MSSITQALNQTNNEFNAALSKQKGSNLDKDSFMLLLVTQFKYQDPLNPMEDKEFIAQMAQFSSLEQLMNLNTSMEGLTEATNNQQMINATSYIGKQVTISGNSIGKNTSSSGETTVSTFRYAFGDAVARGVLTVRDASGNTVYTEDISGKAAGPTFEFTWNGMTSAGDVAPDGVYTVSLAAYNADGEAVLSDQVVDATVTGVVNDDGIVYLGMDGGQLMPLANVRQVSEPKVVGSDNKTETPPDEDASHAENSGGGENTGSSGGENTEATTGQAA
ncbi:flagellar hook assembly protein FlgD [Desulfovibrio sp. SGI.169]|uniref:flagellar hook assembly protein FlgD n=1 Tax=Desulfovibrio sp. SGI.169 TaxID=3420561 RepID=UPI003D00111E